MTRHRTSKWQVRTGHTLRMWADLQGVSRQMIEKRFAKYGTCIENEIIKIKARQRQRKLDRIQQDIKNGVPVSRYDRKLVNTQDPDLDDVLMAEYEQEQQ